MVRMISLSIAAVLAGPCAGQWIEYLEEPVPMPDSLVVHTISNDGRYVAGVVRGQHQSFDAAVWGPDGRVRVLPDGLIDEVFNMRATDDGRVLGTRLGYREEGDYAQLGGEWTADGFVAWPLVHRFLDATPDGSSMLLVRRDEWFNLTVVQRGPGGETGFEFPSRFSGVWEAQLSADGTRVSGYAHFSRNNTETYGETFTYHGGYRSVARFQFGRYDRAFSGNGTTIIGRTPVGDDTFDFPPARRVGDGEPERLADHGYVVSVSDDGRTIVMYGPSEWDSYIVPGVWTPEAGFRSLWALGFDLHRVYDFPQTPSISGDGRIIGGTLWRNWISLPFRDRPVRFHLPEMCPLDYATDSVVDLADYTAFVECFEGDRVNYRSADFNTDGFVDLFDYAEFVDAFERGC